MKNKEHLGDFFKSEFEDFEPELSFKEEQVLHKIQVQNKFYSFDPYHFNVYYALFFVAAFVLNLCCAGHYIYNQINNEETAKSSFIEGTVNTEKKIIENSDVSTSNINAEKQDVVNNNVLKPSKLNNKSNFNSHSNNDNSPISGNELKEIPEKKIIEQQLNHEITPTKEIQIELPKETEVVKTEIKPIRKKVFIIKRDTIFKKDTLKVKRK